MNSSVWNVIHIGSVGRGIITILNQFSSYCGYWTVTVSSHWIPIRQGRRGATDQVLGRSVCLFLCRQSFRGLLRYFITFTRWEICLPVNPFVSLVNVTWMNENISQMNPCKCQLIPLGNDITGEPAWRRFQPKLTFSLLRCQFGETGPMFSLLSKSYILLCDCSELVSYRSYSEAAESQFYLSLWLVSYFTRMTAEDIIR